MKAVRCPTCSKRGDWISLPSAPFCSMRCKTIDLGRWLGEEHRISMPLRPGDFDGYDQLLASPDLDSTDPDAAPRPKFPFRLDSVG